MPIDGDKMLFESLLGRIEKHCRKTGFQMFLFDAFKTKLGFDQGLRYQSVRALKDIAVAARRVYDNHKSPHRHRQGTTTKTLYPSLSRTEALLDYLKEKGFPHSN